MFIHLSFFLKKKSEEKNHHGISSAGCDNPLGRLWPISYFISFIHFIFIFSSLVISLWRRLPIAPWAHAYQLCKIRIILNASNVIMRTVHFGCRNQRFSSRLFDIVYCWTNVRYLRNNILIIGNVADLLLFGVGEKWTFSWSTVNISSWAMYISFQSLPIYWVKMKYFPVVWYHFGPCSQFFSIPFGFVPNVFVRRCGSIMSMHRQKCVIVHQFVRVALVFSTSGE